LKTLEVCDEMGFGEAIALPTGIQIEATG